MRMRGGAAAAAAVLIVLGAGVSGCKEDAIGSAGPEETAGGGGAGGGGAALSAVDSLTVKGRAPKTGYSRERFGTAWADTDANHCDTRDDILKRDLKDVKYSDGKCKVSHGVLEPDPYGGKDVTFTRGRSLVDIDHLVALSDAWQKGAKYWDASKRIALANDPLNLAAVGASANRSKGDGDTATWPRRTRSTAARTSRGRWP